MRVVLVLGAGASLAQGEFFHAIRGTDKNPPLDYTFFDKTRKLQIGVSARLRNYARQRLPWDPFERGARTMRMEVLFKELYYDLIDVPGNDAIRLAYIDLVELYVRVIRETTNWMKGAGGPVGRLLAAAAEVAERVTIVTFNHDLVIENELARRRRLSSRWCLEKGYGRFSEEVTFTIPPAGVAVFREHSDDCDHTRPITVLKLHGSVNWYHRIGRDTPTSKQLTGQAGRLDIFGTVRRTVPAQVRQYVERDGPGRRTYKTWPVVIPPVYAKDALIKSSLATLWEEARLTLIDADAVVFFGYSLPETDVSAERLFGRAMAQSPRTTVTLINPSVDAAARFARIVGAQPLVRFRSVPEFLEREIFFLPRAR